MDRGGKRKRGDASEAPDSAGRPSPHRPDQLDTARRTDQADRAPASSPRSRNNQGSRAGRRNARGGRQQGSRSAGPSSPSEAPTNGSSDAIEERMSQPQQRDQLMEEAPSDIPPTSTPKVIDIPKESASSPPTVKEAPRLPRPFKFNILTDDLLAEWQASGLETVKNATHQACANNDEVALSCLYLEVVRSALDERIGVSEAAEAVKNSIASAPTDSSINAAELFLDTVSILPEVDSTNLTLKKLMLSTDIDVHTMRLVLEEPMLQFLGLVRSTFGKIFVRKQTNVLYRQANYNLLREESEGYSKLITELFKVSHNERMPDRVVETTHQNVKALIGAFDLDAGRVLDVTLDLFATMLIKHGRFFVKFLRHSSYWPQVPATPGIVLDESPNFGSLPSWAEPGQSSFSTSEADKKRIKGLRARRDQDFWSEAKTRGMDAFFGLGQRIVLNEGQIAEQITLAEKALEVASQKTSTNADPVAALRALETKRWIQQTSTLPPKGNPVAAQLLGFKLRFYCSSARDQEDALPLNMVYLTALLIKIGFISLRDLYPHLYPSDEDMAAVRDRQMKKKEEREQQNRPGGVSTNALARAGALSEEPAPGHVMTRLRVPEPRAGTPAKGNAEAGSSTPAKSEELPDQADLLPEPTEQKVPLLKALLLIGAIPESLYMLGRFPWLLDAFQELPSHIHRILHHCLSLLYDQVSPVSRDECLDASAKVMAADQAGLPKGQVRLVDQPAAKKKKWAQVENAEYSFYWEDWADNVPVCRTIDDVFTLCDTFLNILGVKLGQDPTLVMKMARIGKHSLATEPSQSNKDRWRDLLKRVICPSLSLTRSNPGVVNEVYDLLKFFPVQTRFNIYAEWFTGQTSRLPDIATAFDYTRAEARDLMRRINKTNIREMARNLAKASCASPGILFDVCLRQIESYDNLIDVVVEGGRYFTYLAYDVLTWSIMSCLGREGRDQVTETGFVAMKWLQAQSTFAGRIYKRFNVMSSLPILQYVFNQTRRNKSAELRVLREMIFNMAGIEADTNFTDAQVLAMSGGTVLQSLTLRAIGDKRHENKATARRLMRTLTSSNLAAPMLIAIAQHRQTCVFAHDKDVNKILAETFDEVHMDLMQYIDMLRTNLSMEEFDEHVPDAVTLISDYGIEPSIAFTIHRAGIKNALHRHGAEQKSSTRLGRPSDAEKPAISDLEMKNVADTAAVADDCDASNDQQKSDLESKVETAGGSASIEAPSADEQIEDTPAMTEESQIWHPVLEETATRLQASLPEGVDSLLDTHFTTTFWQLDLSDIVAPTISYDAELKRLSNRSTSIDSDKSDMTTAGVKRKEQEKKDIGKTRDQLIQEMKTHIRDYQIVRNRLAKEKDHWFKNAAVKPGRLSLAILQECFLPRMLLSPLDSQFTQRMLFFLHSVGARRFRTLELLGKIFAKNTLTNLIFQCTVKEADNLGRFLFEVLKVMAEWHADQSVYEKKAYGPKKDLPGFATKTDSQGAPKVFLDYEEFRITLTNWHRNLFASINACLQHYEWMHVRNAVTVLNRVVKVFPAVEWMGLNVIEALKMLQKREFYNRNKPEETPIARVDLHVAVNSAMPGVVHRQKAWVIPQAFSLGTFKSKSLGDTLAHEPPSATAPSDDVASVTNADAPQIASSASYNTTEPPLSAARSEWEEGETRDSLMADATGTPAMMPMAPSIELMRTQDLTSTSSKVAPPDSESSAPKHETSSQNFPPLPPIDSPEVSRSGHAVVDTAQASAASSARVSATPSGTPSAIPIQSAPNQTYPDTRDHAPTRRPAAAALAVPSRNETLDLAPNGPRGARQRSSASFHENARYHDNMGPPPAPRGPVERPNERSNAESSRPSRHQDMSYGRLNAEPDPFQSPPSRTTSRGGRLSNAPSSFADRPGGPPVRPIITDRANAYAPVPTDRVTRRQDSRSSHHPSNSAAPSVESPTAPEGVHPSRLAHISEENATHSSARLPATSPSSSGPPLRSQGYPPSPSVAPLGPRAGQPPSTEYRNIASGHSSSLSSGRDPPIGPSYGPNGNNVNRHDGRRQLAGLNDTLRQGGVAAPSSNPNVASQKASGSQNPAMPPRSSNGAYERPRSQQDTRQPPFRSQEPAQMNQPNHGQLPSKPSVVVPQRSNAMHTPSVNPQRALIIEQTNAPDNRGQAFPRDDRQSNAPPRPLQPNTGRPDMARVPSGESNAGASIRGRSSMPDADIRLGGPVPAVPYSNGNGSFPGRPPAGNNALQYDRRNEGPQGSVQTRPHRDAHNDQRDDDRSRRDERHRGRDDRGNDRPMHSEGESSGRHNQPSREPSRDKRVEGDRDRIMRTRETEFAGRSLRSDNAEAMRRGDERDRNPRGNKDLMPTAMPEYRERDRLGGGRARDERGGSAREDLMGPRGDRDGPPQRAAAPSAEYGAPGLYNKDRRGEMQNENRGDSRGNSRGGEARGDGRGDNRRREHGRDRMNGGGSERMKREWNGDDGSRDNKRPRRGNQ